VKFEEDFEAVVVGYEQGTQNLNELEYNQLGLAKRSSHQGNKVPVDILGALICELNGIQFRVGIFKGFSKEDLKLMWSVRDTLIGRIAKLQKMTHGEKDKPRNSRLLGFRAEDYSA
jgi:DNA ligase-1